MGLYHFSSAFCVVVMVFGVKLTECFNFLLMIPGSLAWADGVNVELGCMVGLRWDHWGSW